MYWGAIAHLWPAGTGRWVLNQMSCTVRAVEAARQSGEQWVGLCVLGSIERLFYAPWPALYLEIHCLEIQLHQAGPRKVGVNYGYVHLPALHDCSMNAYVWEKGWNARAWLHLRT